MKVYKAHRLKLYRSFAQRRAMARHAGACRWLWNYMLALQKETYERDGKFVFSHACTGLRLPRPRVEGLVPERQGFPRFKARGKSKDSFYVIIQALRIEASRARLPRLGAVRFRSGRLLEGRIVSGNVSRTTDHWWLTIQCESSW